MIVAVLFISASLGAAGDVLLYRWAKGGGFPWLSGGLLFWLVSLLLFAGAMRWSDRGLSVSFVLTAAFHITLVLAYDQIVERPRLSPPEAVGLMFAIIGIVLIEYGHSLRSERQTPPEPPFADEAPDRILP